MIRRDIEEALRAVGCTNVVVERPRNMEHGDYATNAALIAKVDPHELANKLKVDGVERVEIVGKFINFFLSPEALRAEINNPQIEQVYTGKMVLVEYTSPNLFKPLHIGNLIGNIFGESLARLFEKTGARVKRLNYPSDIGLTIAKGVWGLQKHGLDPEDIAQLGKAYIAGNEAYEDGSAKAEIDEINGALYENSNPEWSELRWRGIETSRRHLNELCRRLGTTFDHEFFESESGPVGAELVRANIGTIFEKSGGAVVYRGAHTRVFLNSAGLPTYEAKELGLFKLKREAYPDFDISITVTGGEQKEFFAVVFDAIKKVFPDAQRKELRHVTNGFLRLTTGKMSSRLGNVITGESLLEELTKAARGREDVAVGAVKYAVLKQRSGRDIVFDPEKSLSLTGDSGPYLQYALVRARSLLREAKKAGVEANARLAGGKTWPSGPERRPLAGHSLERTLLHFPEVLARAAHELEPHHVTTYLTELAGEFNSWYARERVLGGKCQEYGVWLTTCFENVMTQGLHALGISSPEEM